MNSPEYNSLVSEIELVKSLIAMAPAQNVFEKRSLTSRLHVLEKQADGNEPGVATEKITITFQGRPVQGTHGINTNFAAKAISLFDEMVRSVSADDADNLQERGRLPGQDTDGMYITGVALGSFGFVIELPKEPSLYEVPIHTETAVDRVREILRLAAEGSDDQIADVLEYRHPRVLKKVSAYLDYLADKDATFSISYKTATYRYRSVHDVKMAADRLRDDNLIEETVTLAGSFQGSLPDSRAFEFDYEGQVLKGKIGRGFADPKVINERYLLKMVKVTFHTYKIGQGHTRYILEQAEDIQEV